MGEIGKAGAAWLIRRAAALTACALLAPALPAQAPPPGIFSEAPTAIVPGPGAALEPATVRSRVVQVDTQKITAARRGREVMRLNLFDDAVVEVRINRVRPTRTGYFISGTPRGEPWGEVRLVVNGPVMVGTVVTPEGMFTIRFGGSNRHVIRQIDPSAERFECELEDGPLPAPPLQAISSIDRELPAGGSPVVQTGNDPTEDGSETRVLMVYTRAAERRQGGAAGMKALNDLLIQSANQAFEESGVNPRLVLAHEVMVDFVEENTHADLFYLRNAYDGKMDEVHALRNEYAADVVSLIRSGGGGRASALRSEELSAERTSAFIVSGPSEGVFTHEIGHVFGVQHDRYEGLRGGLYDYAYGYVNKRAFEEDAPESARWRTVMAYPRRCAHAGLGGCTWLLRFSNPDQTHLGDAMGVPASSTVTGPDGPADARKTINMTARWVGSFRSEACTDFALSPETYVAPVDGGEVLVKVEATPGCLWEASSHSEFLRIASGARYAGTEFVSVEVPANDSGADRTGTLTVAGKRVTVRQYATASGVCGRSSAIIQALTEEVGLDSAEQCTGVTQGQLAGITFLQLDKQGIGSLKTGDFAGLSGVTDLSLAGNRLSTLPAGLFSGLSSLRNLDLQMNGLTELPAGVFDSLPALRELRLNHNNLSELPSGLFAGLSSLTWLFLQENQVAELPEGIFDGLSSLGWLYLTSNRLSELPAGSFAGLSDLKYLTLENNRIRELSADAFRGLGNLTSLSLDLNRLSELPGGLFAPVPELGTLRMDQNQLIELPEGLFDGLARLNTLDLSSNRLRSLPEGIFSGLTGLRTLRLESNRVNPLPIPVSLEKVDSSQIKAVVPSGAPFELELSVSASSGGTIEGASSLTVPAGALESETEGVARLDGNQEAVTADIGDLPSLPGEHSGYALTKDESLPLRVLPSIDPSDATLSGISVSGGTLEPEFATDITSYESIAVHTASSVTLTPITNNERATVAFLDAGDTPLADSDSARDGHQVNLDIGENTFKLEVSSEDGATKQTYTLVVTRDGATNVCARTRQVLDAIVAAATDAADCTDVTEAQLSQVKLMYLSTRDISTLQSVDFDGLTGLEELDLSYNDLDSLPAGVFSKLSSLRFLHLNDNRLTGFPANIFSGLSAVRFVSLHSNQLTSLPGSLFSRLPELRQLQLDTNQLASLPSDIFSGLSRLTELGLSENKFKALPADIFSELTELRELRLQSNQLAKLPAGIFAGLSGLGYLYMQNNALGGLPEGVFAGLSGLRRLDLSGNNVDPLSLPLTLEKVGDDRFKAVASTGAPFSLEVPISVSTSGSIEGDAETVSIPVGAVESETLGVSRVSGSDVAVTLDIDGSIALPEYHLGYVFEKDESLPQTILPGPRNPAPGQVTGVEVDAGVERLEVSWTGVDGAGGYKVQWKSGEEGYDEARQALLTGGDTLSYTITGLTAGTEYTVRVMATAENADDGMPSGQVTGVPTAVTLGQVTDVEIASGSGELQVSWTAVTDADGYKVQWKSGEQVYSENRQAVISGNDTLSYTITGLTNGRGYTVRVNARKDNADAGPPSEEATATPVSANPDVNGDGTLDGNDALIMYNAYASEALLGDGETGGTAASRQSLLAGYSGKTNPTDDELKEMIRKSLAWQEAGVDAGGDINEDGEIDESDAFVMYYAYTTANLVGNGTTGGTARFRQLLLAAFAGKANPTDEDLKAMLRRANELREEFG